MELFLIQMNRCWREFLLCRKERRCRGNFFLCYITLNEPEIILIIKEEVEQYKQRDPIEVVRKAIFDKKLATEQDLDAIDQKIIQQVEESVKFAEESKFPDPSEALTDVYVQTDYPYILD